MAAAGEQTTMNMKKFINQPENLTQELLEGFALSNADKVELTKDRLIVNKALKDAKRVTIVSLSGSGHEPGLIGFVGEGMLDIAVPGDIFAAPGPEACLEALKHADKGKGVLFIVLNHPGDMLTANKTMELAKQEGIQVMKIVVQEDMSNAPRNRAEDRRGLVGGIVLFKIVGAAAAEGKSLEEIAVLAQNFVDNMATLAVAARGATHPVSGQLLALIGEDEMVFGMGQHGEKGTFKIKMLSADETAATMTDFMLYDLDIKPGEKVMVCINGLGATTLMEMLIVYRKVYYHLLQKGIEIVANWINEILTIQEAAGFQVLMARMTDDALKYWNAPCITSYLVR